MNYLESECAVSVTEEGDGIGDDPLSPFVADEFWVGPKSVSFGGDVSGNSRLHVFRHARLNLPEVESYN